VSRAADLGVNWVFHRLAFAEQTRRPVEEHMKRPTPYFYLDLVALDAIEALQERTQHPARSKPGQQAAERVG